MTTLAEIQAFVGVEADGLWGPRTASAIAKALGVGKAMHHLRNASEFYAGVRYVTGPLDQVQVDTIEALLASAAHWPLSWLAYGYATAWHEARLRPIEEIGKGRGHSYGLADATSQVPYGRGLVQLTHTANYTKMDDALGLGGALVADYSLALKPEIATRILVDGMEHGRFTGKSLADYLPDRLGTVGQFEAARRIINGTDRASLIAGYALKFQDALVAGGWA